MQAFLFKVPYTLYRSIATCYCVPNIISAGLIFNKKVEFWRDGFRCRCVEGILGKAN